LTPCFRLDGCVVTYNKARRHLFPEICRSVLLPHCRVPDQRPPSPETLALVYFHFFLGLLCPNFRLLRISVLPLTFQFHLFLRLEGFCQFSYFARTPPFLLSHVRRIGRPPFVFFTLCCFESCFPSRRIWFFVQIISPFCLPQQRR